MFRGITSEKESFMDQVTSENRNDGKSEEEIVKNSIDVQDSKKGDTREASGKKPGIAKALFFFALPYLINALITCSLIYGYDYFVAQKIVAVDIKGFITAQRELYIKGKIDSVQFQKNVDRMFATITEITPNTIVLMGDAVVRNAKVIDVYEDVPKGRQ
jgi:hypothetical protein